MQLRKNLKQTAFTLIALATVFYGCGQLKSRDDRVAVVGQAPQQEQGGGAAGGIPQEEKDKKVEEIVRNFKELYDMYAGPDGLSRDEFGNIVKKFNGNLDASLTDAIFSLDSNHDGRLTIPEVSEGITKEIPTLGWVRKDEKLTSDKVALHLRDQYPGASAAALAGLLDMLMRFDKPFADGDADGSLSRRELTMPGIIMGVLGKMDFSAGIPIKDRERLSAESALKLEELDKKVQKQIFGRFGTVYDYKTLPKADISLEWTQFALRYYLVDRLIRKKGGTLEEATAVPAFVEFGFRPMGDRADGWAKLRRFYDNPINGATKQDGKLDKMETLNLLTDLEYGARFSRAVNYNLTAQNLEGRTYLYGHLMLLYPRTGHSVFLSGTPTPRSIDGKHIRKEYWDSLGAFDAADRGGNGDSRLDAGELTFAFGYATFLERIFAFYDANRDSLIQRSEGLEMLKMFDIEDERVVDLFFSEAAADFDISSPDILSKIDLLLSGKKRELTPIEFYVRLEKMMHKVVGE